MNATADRLSAIRARVAAQPEGETADYRLLLAEVDRLQKVVRLGRIISAEDATHIKRVVKQRDDWRKRAEQAAAELEQARAAARQLVKENERLRKAAASEQSGGV